MLFVLFLSILTFVRKENLNKTKRKSRQHSGVRKECEKRVSDLQKRIISIKNKDKLFLFPKISQTKKLYFLLKFDENMKNQEKQAHVLADRIVLRNERQKIEELAFKDTITNLINDFKHGRSEKYRVRSIKFRGRQAHRHILGSLEFFSSFFSFIGFIICLKGHSSLIQKKVSLEKQETSNNPDYSMLLNNLNVQSLINIVSTLISTIYHTNPHHFLFIISDYMGVFAICWFCTWFNWWKIYILNEKLTRTNRRSNMRKNSFHNTDSNIKLRKSTTNNSDSNILYGREFKDIGTTYEEPAAKNISYSMRDRNPTVKNIKSGIIFEGSAVINDDSGITYVGSAVKNMKSGITDKESAVKLRKLAVKNENSNDINENRNNTNIKDIDSVSIDILSHPLYHSDDPNTSNKLNDKIVVTPDREKNKIRFIDVPEDESASGFESKLQGPDRHKMKKHEKYEHESDNKWDIVENKNPLILSKSVVLPYLLLFFWQLFFFSRTFMKLADLFLIFVSHYYEYSIPHILYSKNPYHMTKLILGLPYSVRSIFTRATSESVEVFENTGVIKDFSSIICFHPDDCLYKHEEERECVKLHMFNQKVTKMRNLLKLKMMTIVSCLVTEFIDFPPFAFLFDSHALWHLLLLLQTSLHYKIEEITIEVFHML